MNNEIKLISGAMVMLALSTSALVVLPYLQVHEAPPLPGLKPYTSAELRGREVYIANGCVYCHSQQPRAKAFAPDFSRGWGRAMVAGDYAYDQPQLLGTMRTGPDLMNIGVRQPSEQWHLGHLYQPRAFVPGSIRMAVGNLPPVKRFIGMLLRDFKIPKEVLKFITYPTRFDSRETERALKDSGIAVPRLDDYAWRLWDYWERHLDPDLFIDRSLKGKVRNKVVVITGGSSGIGLSTAQRVAEAGATTIIVARGEEELFKARDDRKKAGGKVFAYTAVAEDLRHLDRLDPFLEHTLGFYDEIVRVFETVHVNVPIHPLAR